MQIQLTVIQQLLRMFSCAYILLRKSVGHEKKMWIKKVKKNKIKNILQPSLCCCLWTTKAFTQAYFTWYEKQHFCLKMGSLWSIRSPFLWLDRQHTPAEKSLAAYSSICLPTETLSIEANCQRNPKGKRASLNFRQLHIIHLKAKLLRSNESEADDLSLRSLKSYSPYLVLFPLADGNCVNVSSNQSVLQTSLSPLHCLPSPCAPKTEPQFI